jgi:hypothetical protein
LTAKTFSLKICLTQNFTLNKSKTHFTKMQNMLLAETINFSQQHIFNPSLKRTENALFDFGEK